MKILLLGVLFVCSFRHGSPSSEADFYSQRVQDWFGSTEAEQQALAISPGSESFPELPVVEMSLEQEILNEEEKSTAKSLSVKFYDVLEKVVGKLLWTCVGWSLGVSIPVLLLALAVAYSNYYRRKAEKIQEKILADTLATRHRQSMEEVHATIEDSQGEISPTL